MKRSMFVLPASSRSRSASKPSRNRVRVVARIVLALLGATALPSSSWSEVRVYHSPADDGVAAPAPPTFEGDDVETLFLYVDLAGSEASSRGVPCEDGDGRELCGWDLRLRTSPGVRIVDFVSSDGVVAKLEGRSLRVNGLHGRSPVLQPVRIGRLRVERATTAGGTVAVRGAAVTADLSVEILATTTLAVVPIPEPAAVWAQAAALATAVLLACARGRRTQPRQGVGDGSSRRT